MTADQFGRRYITQGAFISYAKDLGLSTPPVERLLEFAEQIGVITPAARVRYPDEVVRRWHSERYPRHATIAPMEPDGPRLLAATALRNSLENDLIRPSDPAHPLDALAPEHREFMSTRFPREAFTPWSSFRTSVAKLDGHELLSDNCVATYYHAWQVFQLAAFCRSGLTVLCDVAAEQATESLYDLQGPDKLLFINFDGRNELMQLHAHAPLFDAVARFDDNRNRVLQMQVLSIDRSTGRLSASASLMYRRKVAEIGRDVLVSSRLTPKALIKFIQLQCGLWAESQRRHPPQLTDVYKRHIQSTIELLRAARPHLSASEIVKRVGVFGRFRRPVLYEVFPDWVSQQREMVEASLHHSIVPRMAQMPKRFLFSGANVVEFCNWIERKGFLQFYWHFRRLEDMRPFDDQIERTATSVEILGLAALVEHLATQVLTDRGAPTRVLKGTLKPKLTALIPSGPINNDLNHHWQVFTSTSEEKTGKSYTVRQQLLRIKRLRSTGPHTPVLKALLRFGLIRNAVSHSGLRGFRRSEMQMLIEYLLIATLIVWKAK